MRAFLIVTIAGLIALASVAIGRLAIFTSAPLPVESMSTADRTEIEVYMSHVEAILSEYQQAQQEVLAIINEAQADNRLYFSDTWQGELGAALLKNMIVAHEIKAMEPPPTMRDVHDDLLLGSEELLNFTQAMGWWLQDNTDLDALERADERNRAAGAAILSAKAKLENH